MMTTELASINQSLCAEMAVGPSVEKLQDSSTIKQSPIEENCFGLPYEDHNYGRIPSKYSFPFMTRTVNSNLKSVASKKMCVKPPLSIVDPRNTSHFHKNGVIKPIFLPSKLNKKEVYSDSIEADRDVTRCICGFSHDDGYMISCDQCKVWQHIDCVNIDRNNIPDTYLCDSCNPRKLNKEIAIQLQAKKLNDLSIVSEFESSGAESADDRDHSAVTYKAIQSTPTSLTITSNRCSKRTESIGIGKKRKRSKDDNKRPVKKANNIDRKRSRSTSKGSLSDTHTDDQVGTFTWARKLKEWNESYREIDENHYTSELLQAVLSSSCMPKSNCKSEISLLEQLRHQLAKVQRLRNTVLAMEDISIAKPILEFKGSYMLSNQSEAFRPGIYKRPYPHLFFYSGFDGLEIVVDCRLVGNLARYLRRSCKPNSEVRHVVDGNRLHLFVYSKDFISSGSEITIPFDFKYQSCLYDVECGCGLFKDCPVYKFTNMRIARNQANTNESKDSKNKENDGRVSPLRLPISRLSENVSEKINGYPSSDNDNSNVAENEHDGINQENLRKKSREDRKIEFYIRAFERLEEKEKRKEQSVSADSKQCLKDHLEIPANSTISQSLTTPVSITADSKSSHLIAHPAKRTIRRRSTKTGRRNSRKLRAPSYEGVLSPTLSLENNDSNQSMDVASITQDCTNISSVSEQANLPHLIDSTSERLAVLDPDADSTAALQSSCVSLSNDVFPIVTSEHDTATPAVSTELSSSNIMALGETSLPVENKKYFPTESASRSHEPEVSTVPIIKQGKKKSSHCETSGTTTKDVSNTNPVFQSPCCTSFKNWEYRPGIPSGQVHIGIRGTPKWKHIETGLHLKKRWMKFAEEDDMIPKTCGSYVISTENGKLTKQFSLKKRFLMAYAKSEETPGAVQTEQCFNDETRENIITGVETTATHTQIPGLKQSNNSPSNQADLNSSPLSSDLIHDNVLHSYPSIEYESLSDDDEDQNSNKTSPTADGADFVEVVVEETKPHTKNEVRANLDLVSSGSIQESIIGGCDRDSDPKLIYSTAPDDNTVVSSKKKVSIQEYLKRTKEQRRNSLAQQPTTKPMSPPPPTTTNAATDDTVSVSPSYSRASNSTITPSESVKPSPSVVSSNTSSPTQSPDTLQSTSIEKQAKDVNTSQNSSISKTESRITSASNHLKDSKQQSELQEIMEAFTDEGLKNLPPKVLLLFSDVINALEDSSKEVSVDDKNKKTNSEKKPLSQRKETTKAVSTSSHPLVERSNSSPSVRHLSRPGSTLSHSTKKTTGSQDNSPSSHHSTPGSGTHRKVFTSPTSAASPRLIRGHSGSSLNSHSPTPTIYDRRHRAEVSTKESINGGKSRDGSATSDNPGKSPKSLSHDSTRPQNKHSTSQPHQTTSTSSGQDSPPKASPSDVTGQPIPSLARGPGTARVPQVVYTRRPSPPRIDGGSPPWDAYSRDPPPSRLLKDIPYNRHEPYYATRLPSPPPNPHPMDRTSRNKYYDRYSTPPSHPPPPSRPIRREDEPHPPYYHHPYYPPDYRSDRPGYYPPREPRPPSPVSLPRPSPEFYHRSSSYYPPLPPHDYRR